MSLLELLSIEVFSGERRIMDEEVSSGALTK